MARIVRKKQKIFASNALNNGVFGSAQLGTKVLSSDVDTLQGLPAFLNGWLDAVISGQKLPTLEEMQALDYINTYQLSYLFQEGIAEYDADTVYYENSIVKKPGTYQLFGSLVDDNTGNALTDGTKWTLLIDLSVATGGGVYYGTTTNTGNNYVSALSPTLTSLGQGNLYLVKFNAANTGAATLNPNGIGVTPIKDASGAALSSGAIVANTQYILSYDGTNFRILSQVGNATGVLEDMIHVRDEKPSGTDGGSNSLNSWLTRTLNTVVTNNISGASLSSNQVTLPAGTYYVEASAPCYATAASASSNTFNKARLYNVTDSASELDGTSEVGALATSRSEISGLITIAGTKAFIIEHYFTQSLQATSGFGKAVTVPGVNEVYTELKIWKVQ